MKLICQNDPGGLSTKITWHSFSTWKSIFQRSSRQNREELIKFSWAEGLRNCEIRFCFWWFLPRSLHFNLPLSQTYISSVLVRSLLITNFSLLWDNVTRLTLCRTVTLVPPKRVPYVIIMVMPLTQCPTVFKLLETKCPERILVMALMEHSQNTIKQMEMRFTR